MSGTDKRKKISTKIGQHLKHLRKNKNLTIAQSAEFVGVSKTAIFYYENLTRLPSTDVISKFAKAYNESIDTLIKLRELTIIETVELLGENTPAQIKSENDMIALTKKNESDIVFSFEVAVNNKGKIFVNGKESSFSELSKMIKLYAK